ncbi:MAG TPA: hypothetical protein VNX67_04775 [Solirubrobacteraceae bacterium]|jgi:hypothetical protein|nr:hypothetical protein [Solirubrobacteraceae bacterium]
MRRSILTALGLVALALAVPSAALAHHGRGHHHHHKPHHARLHFMHIGASGTSVTTSPTNTAPATPTSPTTPPTPENAGKVASFTGGVLTLTLNDGSTVSGKVTEDTRIGCVRATPTMPPTGTPGQPGEDNSQGDDNGQGDDQSRGDMNQGDKGGDEWQQGDGGDDDQVQGTPEPPCDSSALVAGAVVRAAELRIGPGGNEFESVLLVR